jgi:hypothetical protein
MNLFPPVFALVLSGLLVGCGIEFIKSSERSDGENSSNSKTSVLSKPGAGRITVTMNENDSSAAQVRPPSQKPVASQVGNPMPAPVTTSAPVDPVMDLGSCLVQGSDFLETSPLKPDISSSASRKDCADRCNSMMSRVKFFAGDGGCKYSCEWKSVSLVVKYSNAKRCDVSVATLQ